MGNSRVRRRSRFQLAHGLGWFYVSVALVITAAPFLWMLKTALTPHGELFLDPYQLFPENPTFDNFARVMGFSGESNVDFFLAMRNSFIYAFATTAGTVLFGAMAAYAFSRLEFRGRDALFFVFLAGLLVPPIFTAIPNFVLIRDLGLINTFAGLIAPHLLMAPFAIFFLRQFFLGLPKEVEEAAVLDGANRFTIFARVVLPMAAPALVTLSLILAVSAWNDYLWPLLVATDPQVSVLNVALGKFQQQSPYAQADWGGVMAGSMLSVLPVFVLLLLTGSRMVNALQLTVK